MKLTHLLLATTLTFNLACPAGAQDAKPPGKDAPKDGAKKKGPPPGGKKGGPGGSGGPSQESPEMQALLKSFNPLPSSRPSMPPPAPRRARRCARSAWARTTARCR